MAQKKKWLKGFIHSPIGAWIMAIILVLMVKTIWATCRVRHVNPPKLLRKQHPPKPMIITHWHEYIPYILMLAPPRTSALNSSHADARIVGFASRLQGFRSVWGSSNRNPLSSLRQLKAEIENGRHVLITPDGPRGPYREMALGPVALSHLSGASIVFFAGHASRYWQLKSWDKTRIPKPFSTVTLYWSDEIDVERAKDKERQVTVQKELEAKLIAFSERADRGNDA